MLVILGVFVMTVGVYGVIRMPDTYTRLHAAGKAVFLGVISLCAASVVTGDPAIISRAALVAAFLMVTTPISAFVIARAAFAARGADGGPRRRRRVWTRPGAEKGIGGSGVISGGRLRSGLNKTQDRWCAWTCC